MINDKVDSTIDRIYYLHTTNFKNKIHHVFIRKQSNQQKVQFKRHRKIEIRKNKIIAWTNI
jgi:hypothetical protein